MNWWQWLWLWQLVLEGEEVAVVASSEDQAWRLYEAARLLVEQEAER